MRCAGCGRTIDGEANGEDAIYACDRCDQEVCLDCFRAHRESGRTLSSHLLAEAGAAAIDLARAWERFWGAVRALEASNKEADHV